MFLIWISLLFFALLVVVMAEEPKKKKYKSGHQKRTSKANSIANTLKLDTYYMTINVDENIRNDNDNVDLNVPPISSINDFDLNNDNPPDKAHFTGVINDTTRTLLAKQGACQPKAPIKLNDKDFDVDAYYYYAHEQAAGCSSIKLHRSWLAFSPTSKQIYCHDCLLFADKKDDWVQGFEPNTKHLLRRIKRHERNHDHIGASATLHRWKTDQTIDKENENNMKKKINFWREVLSRIINISLQWTFFVSLFGVIKKKLEMGYVKEEIFSAW